MLLVKKKRGVEQFCSFLWNLQSTILVDMHESYNFFFNLPYNYTLCTYPLDRGQRTIEDPFLQILVKFLILFFENSCYYRSKKEAEELIMLFHHYTILLCHLSLRFSHRHRAFIDLTWQQKKDHQHSILLYYSSYIVHD